MGSTQRTWGLISRVSSRTYRFFQNGQENQRTEKAHAAAEARPKESQSRQPPLRKKVQKLWHRPRYPAQKGPLQVRQMASLHQAPEAKSRHPAEAEGAS